MSNSEYFLMTMDIHAGYRKADFISHVVLKNGIYPRLVYSIRAKPALTTSEAAEQKALIDLPVSRKQSQVVPFVSSTTVCPWIVSSTSERLCNFLGPVDSWSFHSATNFLSKSIIVCVNALHSLSNLLSEHVSFMH
ncbi:unnamed protein product [Albugo candida]|uniref:Uncharacterized protein n=1 Tax=Albugo candida TaxID=65357 RepID=A0A024FWL4_9STRA|nr:unnamed protein product [Albugo candida]|eukprot:CCI11431.1 unnamed protein product [Albugo candida]